MHSGSRSPCDNIAFGIPQGSVLRPLLCTADLVPLIQKHSLYAVICTQTTPRCLGGVGHTTLSVSLQDSMTYVLHAVAVDERTNRLQLNALKTDVHVCLSGVHLPVDATSDVMVGPVQSARDLYRHDLYQPCPVVVFLHAVQAISAVARTKGLSLAAHQTACAVQAVHANPPLFVQRGTIISRRAHRPDRQHRQQTWSEVCTVTVPRCATYSLDILRPHVLHRCARAWNDLP